MSTESHLYPPPAALTKSAHVAGPAAYDQLVAEADRDYDAYWSWSLANAVAAEHLSRELGLGSSGEVFTLGLLVRIGRLALASVHATEYRTGSPTRRAIHQASAHSPASGSRPAIQANTTNGWVISADGSAATMLTVSTRRLSVRTRAVAGSASSTMGLAWVIDESTALRSAASAAHPRG